MIEYAQAIQKATQARIANQARVGMAALYHYMGEYTKSCKLIQEVLKRTSDWDLVRYATYHLKKIDRQLAESTIQGRNQSQCGVGSLAKVFKLLL